MYRVVETDNYGRDYPDEKFATLYGHSEDTANLLASIFNDQMSGARYWKVVPVGYKLQPGFEP